MAVQVICEHDWWPTALGTKCRKCGAEMRVSAPTNKKHELVFNEIDKTVRQSLGLAFCDDQELAIRKAIISAFVAYENFDPASVDTLPKGQDAQQGLAGTEGSAVAATSGETPNGGRNDQRD